MCCCGYPHHDLLQDGSGHGGHKDNQQSSESHDCRELAKATITWRQGPLWGSHVGVIALSIAAQKKWGDKRGYKLLSTGVMPWRCGFWLNDIKGSVHTTQKVTIPHLAPSMYRQTPVSRTLHVSTCPHRASAWSQLPAVVVPTAYLWELHPGSSRYSLSAQSEHPCHEVPTKTIIGQIVPANQVPLVVCPTRTTTETKYLAQKGWVLEALDLQGLKEWPESEQKQAGNCCSNGSTCLHTATWIWANYSDQT